MLLPSDETTPKVRTALSFRSAVALVYRPSRSALLAVGLLLAAVSCAPVRTPDLAQGEHPPTGNARYDKFFADLAELARGVPAAAREVADAQSALARRLGLPDDVRADVVGARLRERTARLASEGLTLQLEFSGIEEVDAGEDKSAPDSEKSSARAADASGNGDPAPTATLRTPGREPEARELRLLEVLAQAALSAASVYVEAGRAQHHLRALAVESAALRAESGRAFPNAGERDMLSARLADADVLSGRLGVQARAATSAADTLISMLDEGANTAPVAPRKRGAKEPSPRDPASKPPARGNPAATEGAPSPSDHPARRPSAKPTEASPAAERAGDFQP